MQNKTWPYGTTKAATVLKVEANVVVLKDEDGEGHVMVGADHEVEPRQGDNVSICFCEGGPTDGYWKVDDILEAS